MAVFAATLLWATLSTVDVIAVAQGKIIPTGYSKVIQPLESGVIRAIHVQNGQEVHAGQVLIELDITASSADHERLVNEHQAARLEVARLRALLAGKDTFQPPSGTDATQLAVQQQLLRDQREEQQTRLEAAALVIQQRQASLAATSATIERLKAIIPVLEERSAAFYQLWQKTYVAKMQYLAVDQERLERMKDLAVQEHKRVQDVAALAEAEKQVQTLSAEFKRQRLSELASVETRVASLGREIVKARSRTQLQHLTAPIDGVVQQLAVHTLGGVVTPAQQLLVLVPQGQLFEVEAWVENKDIGFVRVGQQAEIKVAAFPFTRYGTIPAQVRTLSHDAVQPARDGGALATAQAATANAMSSEHSGLVYAARLHLERTSMDIDGASVSLAPGMAVTVEVKTGTRRVLEYFLSPILQAGQESARER
ncbi:MAG: HlyD family type I secretion periplasmic adaptor subunit [Candidatus Tectomicrobia bacterium]|uniref:HlyD family type I secretion periplasmic adaptor subunit n=1 Tax=Tectimicrobiota bacterium TaxID=2528274 RepID=A0A937W282_UNCTE|nr:HlyD family type I secretion periplasmic adaptor subunit [Candidatus Tectomicrobia bacterium]